jgi:hypothetical protein
MNKLAIQAILRKWKQRQDEGKVPFAFKAYQHQGQMFNSPVMPESILEETSEPEPGTDSADIDPPVRKKKPRQRKVATKKAKGIVGDGDDRDDESESNPLRQSTVLPVPVVRSSEEPMPASVRDAWQSEKVPLFYPSSEGEDNFSGEIDPILKSYTEEQIAMQLQGSRQWMTNDQGQQGPVSVQGTGPSYQRMDRREALVPVHVPVDDIPPWKDAMLTGKPNLTSAANLVVQPPSAGTPSVVEASLAPPNIMEMIHALLRSEGLSLDSVDLTTLTNAGPGPIPPRAQSPASNSTSSHVPSDPAKPVSHKQNQPTCDRWMNTHSRSRGHQRSRGRNGVERHCGVQDNEEPPAPVLKALPVSNINTGAASARKLPTVVEEPKKRGRPRKKCV